MNQKTYLIIIVAIFVLAAFIGGYLLRGPDGDPESAQVSASPMPPTATPLPSVAVPPPTQGSVLHTVTFTASGPSPKTLSVRVGDAVRFRNAGAADVWPASDPHPSHTLCPELDARRALRNGEEYTLTLTSARTCTYHSHLDPSNEALRGTITVR